MARPIRWMPQHVILRKLRERGVTQKTVAKRAKVSHSYVSATLARRVPPGRRCEAVWAELERILGGAA